MAPVTFSLIQLHSNTSRESFIETTRTLPASERPLYLGACQHWIHAPQLSAGALTGTGNVMQSWDYLLAANASSLPDEHTSFLEKTWSITAGVPDEQLAALKEAKQQRAAGAVPELPKGWSPSDHSALDASDPPPDLEASLGLSSYRLGSEKTSTKPVLKQWVAEFGDQHPGPVDMFNLLSYHPDGRPRYFQYIAAFTESVGSKYGGDPVFTGLGGIVGWSSQADENREEGVGWEDTALVHYPSIYHFAKMLDDPIYADVDRKYKQGALRDNPLICCTEIDLD